MSPQDSQLLQDFLNQLVQARGVPKDPEAEAKISKAVAQQPDAAYLLVQRSLLQQQALDNARAEIAALQNQLRAGPQTTPAFLDPNAWGNSGSARPAGLQTAPAGPAQYQPSYQPSYQQQPPLAQAPGGGFLRGGMGGTLGTIASTAAGVAAGAFLFQGLEHLLGNHAGNGFLGSQNAFSSLTAPLENITNNNFYGSENSGSSLADNLGTDNLFSNDAGSGTTNDLADNPDEGMFDPDGDDDLFT